MTFVNCVAKLVHAEVRKNKGAVNKNIGEAFLLTWKTQPKRDPMTQFDELAFVQGKIVDADTGKKIDRDTERYYKMKMAGGGLPGLEQQVAADSALDACNALVSTMDATMDVRLEKELCKGEGKNAGKSILQVLRTSPLLHSKFRLDMGVGLNYGWGIEGAIGSEHKVDASYLSPNVNTAGECRLSSAHAQPLVFLSC